MKFKVIMGIMLTLLLSMLTLAFNIQPVKASGTIRIRADGSIDPPTAPILTVDNVTYTFTGNIYESIVVERSNIVIDGNGYMLQGTGAYASKGIDLSGRTNVTVRNTQIENFYYGIWLYYSSNNSISGNNVTNNRGGIRLGYSSNNSVSGNNITNNWAGIYLYYSSNNSISGSNIANNGDGIVLYYSSNYTSVSGNNITNNESGISVYSSNNSVSGNTITANIMDGIALYDSSNNSISANNITNNGDGIALHYSSNNKFYHNFIDNTQQVSSDGYANIWDDGYPSGGNYWSDYTRFDDFSGPYQNVTGSDGIGDTPYTIDADNQDNYPLMNPWTPTETVVKMGGRDYLVTVVSNTTIDQIVATKNTLHFESSGPTGEKGYILVIFPLVNTTSIKVLIDGKLTPPPFPVINTNGTHYFIYFELTPSTHKIAIQYSFPGDATGEGYVNVLDLGYLSDAWLTEKGEPYYNPDCDFNWDGFCNVLDLGIMSDNWLKSSI